MQKEKPFKKERIQQKLVHGFFISYPVCTYVFVLCSRKLFGFQQNCSRLCLRGAQEPRFLDKQRRTANTCHRHVASVFPVLQRDERGVEGWRKPSLSME